MTLNATAIFIWENCDGKQKLDDILQKLVDIYEDEDQQRLKTDLLSAIDKMLKNEFIQKV